MLSFIFNEWFVFPILGTLVSLVIYFNCDRVLNWFYAKSLGQKEAIFEKMDRMFVQVSKREVLWLIIAMSFGLGLLVFIAVWPKVWVGLFLATVMIFVGWSIPKLIMNQLYEMRCNLFVNQLVDGLTIMGNGIKSGLSVPQAMERVVENMGNPLSQEFNLALSQVRIGQSLEEALNELGERIPRPDVQMLVNSINILKETGGNLAETFTTIVSTIRDRQKIEKKIQALTAQGIAQGVIITLVPFVLLIVFWVIDSSYIRPMFSTTLGWVLLFVMLILQVLGGLMIRRIVKINV